MGTIGRLFSGSRSAGPAAMLLVALVASADAPIAVGNATAIVLDGANTSMNFQITGGGNAPVVVGYTTLAGSAQDDVDYHGIVGSVTLPAGSTSVNLPPVPIIGEPGMGANKQFTLQLLGVGGTGPLPVFGAGEAFDSVFGYSIVAADFNGDGKPDVATNYAGMASVSLNTTVAQASSASFGPSAAFTSLTGAPNAAESLLVADFNGDGKPDLAAVGDYSSQSSSVGILINTSVPGAATASFSGPTMFALSEDNATYYGVAVADFNGDGRPDLVDFSTDGLEFLLNTTAKNAATPTFQTADYPLQFPATSFTQFVGSADFNGDGKPDLAILLYSRYSGCIIQVVLNTTAPGAAVPTFSPPVTLQGGIGQCLPFLIADFNGDGVPDLLALGNTYPYEGVNLLLNTTPAGATTASFSGPQLIPTATYPPLAVADLNGDGKPEFIESYYTSLKLGILTNVSSPGGDPQVVLSLPEQLNAPVGAVAVADINGDGLPDLVVGGGSLGFEVLLNNTAPSSAVQPGAPNVSATGTIQYQSNIPNAFSFAPLNNAPLNAVCTSNPITVSGINVPASISVSGGQYSVNGGSYTAAGGTVQPASSVTVQLLSSSSYFTGTQATLTIGGVSGTYTVTTQSSAGTGSGCASTGSSSGGSSSSGSGSSSGGASSSSSSSGSGGGSTSSSSGSSGSGGGSTSSSSSSSGSGGGSTSSSSSSSGSGGGSTSSSSGGSGSGGGGSTGGGGGGFNPLVLLLLGTARIWRAHQGRRRGAARVH